MFYLFSKVVNLNIFAFAQNCYYLELIFRDIEKSEIIIFKAFFV